MAQTKELFTRIQHKHDIEANWIKAVNFTPLNGEIIVYDKDDEHDYVRIKIGDNKTLVSALPFITKDIDTKIGASNDAANATGTLYARIAKNKSDIAANADDIETINSALNNMTAITEAEIDEICGSTITSEAWTFALENGSTIKKDVVIFNE